MASERDQRLPRELANEVSRLESQDDEALWRTARSHLSGEAASRLEALNAKQKNEGLTAGEKEDLEQLLFQYDRYLLLRAYAAKVLKERGRDISGLVPAR